MGAKGFHLNIRANEKGLGVLESSNRLSPRLGHLFVSSLEFFRVRGFTILFAKLSALLDSSHGGRDIQDRLVEVGLVLERVTFIFLWSIIGQDDISIFGKILG